MNFINVVPWWLPKMYGRVEMCAEYAKLNFDEAWGRGR
jgi:hypothetical protein